MRIQSLIVVTTSIGLLAGCSHSSSPVAKGPATAPSLVKAAPIATFGGAQTIPDSQAVSVVNVIASPEQYAGKHVKISGIVGSVCPTKGCWLRVTPEPGQGHGNVFVKFMDPPEGRLIPMEALGHEVTVEGTLKNGKISEAQAKHLAQDAGASDEDLAKIVGPQPQLTIGSPRVAIEGVGK